MPTTLEAFAHGGETWAKKRDTTGRVYATRSDGGRVPIEVFETAKNNGSLDDFEL